jgi:rhamnulose-1-phosphate aldolase
MKYTSDFEKILEEMSEVGGLLHEMRASEGGAGNITVMSELEGFNHVEYGFSTKQIHLPFPVPHLAGRKLVVTGSGCRLRDLVGNPLENVGLIEIMEDGRTGIAYYLEEGNFKAPTSEYNTHLKLIQREVEINSVSFFAVLHAQPLYLTFLTHIPAYQDELILNRALYRWQAEQIVFYPYGITFVPFLAPGSDELMVSTYRADSRRQFIVWSKHGVVSLSAVSLPEAMDSIEYFEAAAQYEYLNIAANNPASGLDLNELTEICEFKQVDSDILKQFRVWEAESEKM